MSELEKSLTDSIQRNKLSMRLFATAVMFFAFGYVAIGGDREWFPAMLGVMYVLAVLR